MQPYANLIGAWDMEINDIAIDGTTKTFHGTWHFYWGLGGRAVLDVWTVAGREHGLTVRFFDAARGLIRSTWIAPQGGLVMPFIGHISNGEIILVHNEGDISNRWIFSDITAESFSWRGERSTDGKHWTLEQTMFGKRVAE